MVAHGQWNKDYISNVGRMIYPLKNKTHKKQKSLFFEIKRRSRLF